MSNILKTMRESNNDLLKTESEDLATWSKLRHTKEDFELFLQFNIAEVEFKTLRKTDSSIICTSNSVLIKIFNTKRAKDKKKLIKLKNDSIKTNKPDSILTWDLVENKFKTMPLISWQIINFISITPKNILILDELLNKLLKQ